MAANNEEKVIRALEELRGEVRKFRGGMQSHEAEDQKMQTVKVIDNIELELFPKRKE